MARLTPLTDQTAPDAARASLPSTAGLPARIQAYWPSLLSGVEAMTRALNTDRLLPESLLRLVRLRTAQIIGCPY